MPPPVSREKLSLIVLLATDRLAAHPKKQPAALIPPQVEFPLIVLLVIVSCAAPKPCTEVKMPPPKLPLTAVLTIVVLAAPSVAPLLIPRPSLSLTSQLTTVRLALPFAKALKTIFKIPCPELLLRTLSVIVMQAQRPSGLDCFAELRPDVMLAPSGLGRARALKAPVPELLLMMLLATVMEAPVEASEASL